MLPPKLSSEKDLAVSASKKSHGSPELTLRGTQPPQQSRLHGQHYPGSSTPFEEERRMARQETIRSLHEHRRQESNNNNQDNSRQGTQNFHIEQNEPGVTYVAEDGLVKSHKASLRGSRPNDRQRVSGSWFNQEEVLRKQTYQQQNQQGHGIARQTQSLNTVTSACYDDQYDKRHYERQKTSRSLHDDYARPSGPHLYQSKHERGILKEPRRKQRLFV